MVDKFRTVVSFARVPRILQHLKTPRALSLQEIESKIYLFAHAPIFEADRLFRPIDHENSKENILA